MNAEMRDLQNSSETGAAARVEYIAVRLKLARLSCCGHVTRLHHKRYGM